MANVLVTGGAGYIGSHACKALVRSGYTPVAYDNLGNGHEWAVKWGPLERGDVRDLARLQEVFAKYRPTAVVHFAAHAYVGESVEDPGKYYDNNVGGSLTLLQAMRSSGVDTLVFSSTCATYGMPVALPITEQHPQQPINPYGSSKLMVERMLADFGRAYGLRSVSLRYFNAAGADPEMEIGEDHDPETHLIPIILEAAAGRRPAAPIHGTDYDTPDGTCIRDFIHVSDLADAHVLALKALKRGGSPASYNLGTGTGHSVRQVIETAARIAGRRIPVRTMPRRPGDPPQLVADASLARSRLSWKPKFDALSAIVETAWNWQAKHGGELDGDARAHGSTT